MSTIIYYICDSCETRIYPYARRVVCLECGDHQFCMGCHNRDATSIMPAHRASHASQFLLCDANFGATNYPSILLQADGAPSSSFISFCDKIFNQIDESVEPANTRLLEPSKLAAAENELKTIDITEGVFTVWQQVIDNGGTHAEADKTLAAWYTTNEIKCVMATRKSDNPVWHGMPALTRAGFRDVQMLELKRNSKGYSGWIDMVLRECLAPNVYQDVVIQEQRRQTHAA